MKFILLRNLPNIQNNAVCCNKYTHCKCVHMVTFLLADNSQKAFKICKGVKTAPGVPVLHTQIKICCKEVVVQKPVPNCDRFWFVLKFLVCVIFQSKCNRVGLEADRVRDPLFAVPQGSDGSIQTYSDKPH